jgi:hypothetical protein
MTGFKHTTPSVLGDDALIPPANLVSPPPQDELTHGLSSSAPYWFAFDAPPGTPPDGALPDGTKVRVLGDGHGAQCRVVDGRGLYVAVERAALRPL